MPSPSYSTGLGALSKLSEIKGLHQPKKTLLVRGKQSFVACGAAKVIGRQFDQAELVSFSDFETNPKVEDALRGVELARANKIDLIIAVGGGSAMDMAKLIKAFYRDPTQVEAIATGVEASRDPAIPLVCIPTTAGSGSEATQFAVVYIGKEKFSLVAPHILPNQIILDGALIKSNSSRQRAINGLDAVAQAIESAWAVSSSSESQALAFEALALSWSTLPKVVHGGSPLELQTMLEAANLAGQAINHTRTTAAHAFSYAFTSHHGVPHGHAVWLTLPAIFQAHLDAEDNSVQDPRGPTHLAATMDKLVKLLGIRDKSQACQTLKDFVASLGLETDMSKLGAINLEQRSFLSHQVNLERMGNNPVQLSNKDIAGIFDLKGES